ncbi:MAG: S46 family peptidase [Lewinellaceae bacterium]|nr:S46 family peptidase [Lewinellaceae bacterium]
MTETYRDVRLVGARPLLLASSAPIPTTGYTRHTGDFSVFRIYALPATYPPSTARKTNPTSPGTPCRFPSTASMPTTSPWSSAFRTGRKSTSPPRHRTAGEHPQPYPHRDSRPHPRSNERSDAQRPHGVRLQYVSKQSRIANSWKKWIGESQGIRRTNAIAQRHSTYEKEFQKRVDTNPEWKEKYGSILPRFRQLYAEQEPYAKAREYLGEIAGRNVELFRYANTLHRLVKSYDASGAPYLEPRMGPGAGLHRRILQGLPAGCGPPGLRLPDGSLLQRA